MRHIDSVGTADIFLRPVYQTRFIKSGKSLAPGRAAGGYFELNSYKNCTLIFNAMTIRACVFVSVATP